MIPVAHLIDLAGATGYFRSIARHHDRERYRLSIGSLEPADSLQPAMEAMDVGTFDLGVRGRRWYWRAVPGLALRLRRQRIRILHLHTFYASAVGMVAARLAGVPHVVTTRHHSDHLLRLDRPLHHRMDRWVTARADRVIAVSEGTRRIMIEEEGADPSKVVVVHNGIEAVAPSEAFDPAALRRELELGAGPVGVTVARLHEEKGHRFLLQALPGVLERWPDFTLVVVGQGDEGPALRARARELGVQDRVRFTGYRDDAVDLMAMADLTVLPSLAESFGFVLVESMAVGTPPVATRTGGVPEVVADGETGLLVPPGDAAALAGAILRLLGDAGLRSRLGRAGRERARTRFTARAMVAGYEAVYETLLREELDHG